MTHSPSVHDNTTTISFSADRCVILLLPVVWSVYAYGIRALFITLVSVLFASVAYLLFCLALKKEIIPHIMMDIALSAAVFAFTLPVSVPYYLPMLGGVIAAVPSLWLPKGKKICWRISFCGCGTRPLSLSHEPCNSGVHLSFTVDIFTCGK